jgi:hypothetical protein
LTLVVVACGVIVVRLLLELVDEKKEKKKRIRCNFDRAYISHVADTLFLWIMADELHKVSQVLETFTCSIPEPALTKEIPTWRFIIFGRVISGDPNSVSTKSIRANTFHH